LQAFFYACSILHPAGGMPLPASPGWDLFPYIAKNLLSKPKILGLDFGYNAVIRRQCWPILGQKN